SRINFLSCLWIACLLHCVSPAAHAANKATKTTQNESRDCDHWRSMSAAFGGPFYNREKQPETQFEEARQLDFGIYCLQVRLKDLQDAFVGSIPTVPGIKDDQSPLVVLLMQIERELADQRKELDDIAARIRPSRGGSPGANNPDNAKLTDLIKLVNDQEHQLEAIA